MNIMNEITSEDILIFLKYFPLYQDKENIDIKIYPDCFDETRLNCDINELFMEISPFHITLEKESRIDFTIVWFSYLYALFKEEYEELWLKHINSLMNENKVFIFNRLIPPTWNIDVLITYLNQFTQKCIIDNYEFVMRKIKILSEELWPHIEAKCLQRKREVPEIEIY